LTAQLTILDNGLRVVTDSMETVETVALGAWVGVGTRHEDADQNGISHLLEHMAFKGTARRSASDIAAEIEAVGGHLNAYTSRETTAYYAKVLNEDVPLAVDLLSDILQHSTFDPQELERERSVILQEIGQALDQPEDVVFDAFQATAYPDQALGRPVLGQPEVIRSVSRQAIIDYMTARYRTSDIVLAAAGRISHDAFVSLVRDNFGELPTGHAPAAEPARYAGGEHRDVQDLEQVHLVLGFDGLSFHHPDFYALQVFSALYGGGMSSRLFQEVREKRGLVYTIYSFASGLSDSGILGVYAGTGEKEAEEVVRIVCGELAALGDTVSAAEVQRARAQLKASILMSRESTSARCEQAATQVQVFGRPLAVGEVVEKIEAVDTAKIRELAGRLASTQPTFAAIGPVGHIAPFEEIRERLRLAV